jgi:tetratricopeptide (TPR) repeat protein
MGGSDQRSGENVTTQVERLLRQCPDWSRSGRHRKVVSSIDEFLPLLDDRPRVTAALLVWKAQALLALGRAEQAQRAATRSWDLQPTPHACHLSANAEEALGNHDDAEELLQVGWRMFPAAVHLPVQLAIILADQGRVPEAHEVLEQVPLDAPVPPDLDVFLFGMRSNLLAAMGHWAEAEDLLQQGITHHPHSNLLSEAQASLRATRSRIEAEANLADSWRKELQPLEGGAHEVDEAIIRCGTVNELTDIAVLAARRLWRAYLEHHAARPHAPEVWGTAFVVAVLELDDEAPNTAAFARSTACRPASVRKVLRNVRDFLGGLEPEFAKRAFAAGTNPRLEGTDASVRKHLGNATVIPFPTQ